MAAIRRQDPDCWQLDKITSIRANDHLRNDGMDDMEESPVLSRGKQPISNGFGARLPEQEEKLILSDDDIVD